MSDHSTDSGPFTIAVLSAVDPTAWSSDVAAAVIRHHLGNHSDSVSFDFRTVSGSPSPRQRAAWKPASAAPWPVDSAATVVDHSLDVAQRTRAGLGAEADVIVTDLFDDIGALVSLFEATLDPVAIDTRRRMLAHLGVLAPAWNGADEHGIGSDGTAIFDGALSLFGGWCTPTDRFIIAASIDETVVLSDPTVAALAAGATESSLPVSREITRISAAMAEIDPTADTTARGLRRRVADLEAEVAHLREAAEATDRRVADSFDRAAAREQTLLNRLEAATLRADIDGPLR